MSSAVPVWYGFRRLLTDLWWAEVTVPPEALLAAHARYAGTIQSAIVDALPFAVAMQREAWHGRPIDLSQEERTGLVLHRKRMLLASDAAEARLFEELAGALGNDEPARLRLQELRERRSAEATIDRARRAAGVGADCLSLPRNGSVVMRQIAERGDLSPEERRTLVAVEQRHASERRLAWTRAESSVARAVEATLALQSELARVDATGVARGRAHPVAPSARAAVIAAEWELLQELLSHSPGDVASRRVELAMHVLLPVAVIPWLGTDVLPIVDRNQPRTERELATRVLVAPGLTAEQRDSARPILEEWCREVDAALAAALIERIQQLRGAEEPEPGTWDALRALEPEWLMEFAARRLEIARRMRSRLVAATGLSWKGGEPLVPISVVERADDAADEEAAAATHDPESHAVATNMYRNLRKLMLLQVGPVPIWPIDELPRLCPLAAEPAAHRQQVLVRILEDARADWASRVSASTENEDAAPESFRLAWREADGVMARLKAALDAAAPETECGMTVGQRVWMDWLMTQEIMLQESDALPGHRPSERERGVLDSILRFRGSAADRQAMLQAVAAALDQWTAEVKALRDLWLDVTEARRGSAEVREDEAIERLRVQWPRVHAVWVGRVVSEVPAALARRWQNEVRVAHASERPALGDAWRHEVEVMLSARPEWRTWVEKSRELVAPELDARDAWVCSVTDELERVAGASVGRGIMAPREIDRTLLQDCVAALLERPCQDYVERAMYRLAHALPPEVAQSLPLMRLYLR